MRSTHLAADRATLFMRQAGQGGAAPGLKHNSCSLAGLTFASLGHGNSRARRGRDQAPFTQLFVFSSQHAGRHSSVTGRGGICGSDAPDEEREGGK